MSIPSWKSGLQEIAPNVFAYIHSGVGWDICNSGFIVSDDGVMVIDAMMVASMVRPYLEEIRKVTDQPIRYVVNTHHHVDHSLGNQFYLPTEVVSHRACREAFLTRFADMVMLSLPIPKFDPKQALHFGLPQAAQRAEKATPEVPLPEVTNFITARRRIREALWEDGVAQQIDDLVAQLLGY